MVAAPSRPVALGLSLGAVGALCGVSSFVSPAAPQVQGNLRTSGGAPGIPHDVGGSQAGAPSLLAASSLGSIAVAAGMAAARRRSTRCQAAKKVEITPEFIPRPEDLLESDKFPKYMGGTGGYMSRATRERHAITWTAKEEQLFEMPTGGVAIMNKGENLCYFRKKEQCLALGKQLRKSKIENYKIYRLKKDGTVIFMHPADGVFPEKVNKGRVQVNGRPFSVAQNAQPGDLRFTKYAGKNYEADPLTTMFVKARLRAFTDMENLFAIPQPNAWASEEEWPEMSKQLYEELMNTPDPESL